MIRVLFLMLCLFWSAPVLAQTTQPQDGSSADGSSPIPVLEDEDDTFSFKFGFYKQDDGANNTGGNFLIDEDMTVYEAIIVLDQQISEKDHLNVRFLGDLISSASQSRYHDPMYRALQSNPSGNKHGELGLGLSHEFESFSLGGNVSAGAEFNSYYSFGYGANLAIPFNNDNTTFSFLFQGYSDVFEVKLFNGLEPGYDNRQTYTFETSLTQIFSPTTVGRMIYNHTEQHGYLATTWHAVVVNGLEAREVAPPERRRDSITFRLRQSLSELNAIEVGYRFYNDSWEIYSHTVESRFFQYLFGKKLLLEPNYRFYTQQAAYFYQPVFFNVLEYRTSDPDLGEFDGHVFGIKATLLGENVFEKWNADFDIGYNYYLRDDDLDIFWIEAGYTHRF